MMGPVDRAYLASIDERRDHRMTANTEHEAAYKNHDAQLFTLLAILEIAGEIPQ